MSFFMIFIIIMAQNSSTDHQLLYQRASLVLPYILGLMYIIKCDLKLDVSLVSLVYLRIVTDTAV